MGKGSIEPATGQEYDLHYVSQLSCEEIQTYLAEKTVPFHPRKANCNPLLLQPQENGTFYLVSTGHHYFMEACGIALLRLGPQPGTGNTIIDVIWKKKVPFKPRGRDVLIPTLLLALLVLLQFIDPMDIHALIRGGLSGIAGGLIAKVIVHFTAPKYRVEEQKRLQTFLEENLLD